METEHISTLIKTRLIHSSGTDLIIWNKVLGKIASSLLLRRFLLSGARCKGDLNKRGRGSEITAYSLLTKV